ncbi:MAG TPA: regulatory protein RecX [Syntrophales bacterium]|nr:regulatory protein RecX [Syntrophobacterales bacterium]HQL91365.1 regulatory protein RecX [Syntrophales bacterium]
MEDHLQYKRARERALRLLALRGRSRAELRKKLAERDFSKSVIDRVLENLGALGYLDDEAFAVNRARHLAVNRLYGDRKIAEQLREKGVDPEAARAAIREVREEFPELEGIARSAARKLQGRGLESLGKKERLALARTLQGKGYHLALILDYLGTYEEGTAYDAE